MELKIISSNSNPKPSKDKKIEGDNTVWAQEHGRLYLRQPVVEFPRLENRVYKLVIDGDGIPCLIPRTDRFNFNYKIYGLEDELITRTLKSWKTIGKGNLGVLLNGLKGTGKTVTAKILANKLEQPIIVVGVPGAHNFLNSIPQDITIFLDEYEKVFNKENEHAMLTIMDGALNSQHRRLFVLTTNHLNVDENLLQRPGRVRYLKKYTDLEPIVVDAIVDDLLENKELKTDTIKFISSLQFITVDIVKSIVQEVNIHNEAPEAFANVFNVKKIKGKYNVSIKKGEEFEQVSKNITISPRPFFDEGIEDNWLNIAGDYVGKIVKIINFDTIEVEAVPKNKDTPAWLKKEKTVQVKVENAEASHYNYKFGGGKMKGVNGDEYNERYRDDF